MKSHSARMCNNEHLHEKRGEISCVPIKRFVTFVNEKRILRKNAGL